MSESLRYNATKVVGEYGGQARLQQRLHLSPDANGKWVKWEDYCKLRDEYEFRKAFYDDIQYELERMVSEIKRIKVVEDEMLRKLIEGTL
jgi:hypothetical protein